jgi:hypothetical protein
MVLFHKYVLQKETFQNEREFEAACIAVLFLSTKICNFLVSLTRLIQSFLLMRGLSSKNAELLNKFSSIVQEAEVDILCTIGFDINVDLPYSYIEKMKPYLEEFVKDAKLIKIIYNFVNDSFKLPVILYYSPVKIALSAIYLLGCHFKVNLPDTKEGIKWYEYLHTEISLDEIKEISSIINSIYIQLKKQRQDSKTNIGKHSVSSNLSLGFSLLNRKRFEVTEAEVEQGLTGEMHVNTQKVDLKRSETNSTNELSIKEDIFE